MITHATTWKLRKVKRPHAVVHRDAANAFPSTGRGAMDKMVDQAALDKDKGMLRHRHRGVRMTITTPRGGKLRVRPGVEGLPRGRSHA